MEKRLIIVLPAQNFNDQEYQDTKEVLSESGAIVKIASSTTEEAVGISSVRVPIDISFENIISEEFDGLIFISGPGVNEYFNDSRVLELIREFHQKGKLVAAISRAVEILARSGILASHQVTISPDDTQALISRHISYTGEEITVDGNVITAANFAYGNRFGKEIVKYLKI